MDMHAFDCGSFETDSNFSIMDTNKGTNVGKVVI